MDKYSVDRIEDGTVVLEGADGKHKYICICDLPEGTGEGSILGFDGERFSYLAEETEEMRASVFDLAESLFDDEG